MQTRVSTKGQIVLPGPLRRRLGIRAGDPLDVAVEGERIVLTLSIQRPPAAKIVSDPITGLPVFSAGQSAPTLSSKDVDEILSNFPMTYLLDVNALVALALLHHEFHPRVVA